jgi:hypothetical protein
MRSSIPGLATNVLFSYQRVEATLALRSQTSSTSSVAATSVWTRWEVVRPPVPPMLRIPPGSFVPVPVRNSADSSTFFASANRRPSSRCSEPCQSWPTSMRKTSCASKAISVSTRLPSTSHTCASQESGVLSQMTVRVKVPVLTFCSIEA